MEYSTAAKLAQLPFKGKSPRRITGSQANKASLFALSDIHKVIFDRHGGPAIDPAWVYRYLEAALPSIISTHRSWMDAVHEWCLQHVPVILIAEGEDFIRDEAVKVANRGKSRGRRMNENDRIAKLIGVTQDHVDRLGLCSLQAAHRTKAVRARERAEKKADAKREARKQAGATPQAQSARRLEPWKAEGISRADWYARKAKEKLAITMACEGSGAILDNFGPNITEGSNLSPADVADGTVLDNFGPNIPVAGPERVPGQLRTQHIFVDPKPKTPNETIRYLISGQEAARDAYALLDPVFAAIAAEEDHDRWRLAA